MDIYADNILDHYKRPRGKDESLCVNEQRSCHSEKNPSCGDSLIMELEIDNGIVKIKWNGSGCAISQAAISLLSEEIEGKTEEEILKLNKKDIIKMLGVPISTSRIKCALLCLHTIKNTIKKSKGEVLNKWEDTLEIDHE
ncbi:iron-sulfur cluster assembly scaffold protein [Candidatus Peregrinibacteria bacterium]|jgi:nitrogen fixation protein NifU and related proteins|nr:iron-sulfur cluster assembly scaffold protein [Candidatus Peregrinibacteria bacterium]MBT3598723.1 iron-sulfur cluster assembly scaffold protein [Candidatus Peregrinibacteria bacterium]MBT4366863.1 iron-sulfur cluster assembly scaffold protein [Candidatus Peregrinibacteria bacterium]MBT4585745.1 iron-sulfur cluster assembly scaffold protein [Candidatus Peregrinibacteria bacterium]MBT6731267.1 iron-sulfur cluster assembly scaffold protein [Candidatus Peregrinibacteria bacterium]